MNLRSGEERRGEEEGRSLSVEVMIDGGGATKINQPQSLDRGLTVLRRYGYNGGVIELRKLYLGVWTVGKAGRGLITHSQFCCRTLERLSVVTDWGALGGNA